MAQVLCIIGGLISGVAAGMGMGGGTILIPVLTLLVSIDQHAAQGINMLSFLPAAIVAIFIHRREGRIDFKDCIPIIIAGIIGAVGGAMLAMIVSSEWLRRIFGMFLLGLAIIQLISGEKNKDKGAEIKKRGR